MTDRPTPETDAFFRTFVHGQAAPSHAEYYDRMRCLEREREEAREAAENAKAYKRVLKQDNAKLRRERDDALEQLAAERVLAGKLTQWIVDWRAGFGTQMPDKNCDCVDCETLIAVDELLNTTKNRPSED